MVAKSSRSGHNDMGASGQRATFIPNVHAPDARGQKRSRSGIQPAEFPFHLKCQLAGRCDNQRQRCFGFAERFFIAQHPVRYRQTKPNGLP